MRVSSQARLPPWPAEIRSARMSSSKAKEHLKRSIQAEREKQPSRCHINHEIAQVVDLMKHIGRRKKHRAANSGGKGLIEGAEGRPEGGLRGSGGVVFVCHLAA